MTYVRRRDTGSEMLDRIRAERDRIRATWSRPKRILLSTATMALRIPPLPIQKGKPLKKRIAEAMKLRGQISEEKLRWIINAIYGSARDSGEYVVENETYRKSAPEITAPGELTIAKIQTVVAEHYNLTREEMLTVRRDKRIILPRHIAMYLSAILLLRTYTYIGERFDFDHASIIHATKKIKKMIAADAEFAHEIAILRGMLMP